MPNVYVDPKPVTAEELGAEEMSTYTGGGVVFTAGVAVIKCGASFGAVVISVTQVVLD